MMKVFGTGTKVPEELAMAKTNARAVRLGEISSARTGYLWWRPPTSGSSTISPMVGGWT